MPAQFDFPAILNPSAEGTRTAWPKCVGLDRGTIRIRCSLSYGATSTTIATERYICYHFWMRTINQRQLRNESAAILRDVQAGQHMIVTRNGTPVAELKPVSSHRFVPRAAIAAATRIAPRIDATRFRSDIDAFVDQHVDV